MRQLTGNTSNINSDILAKVTTNCSIIRNRSKYVLVKKGLKRKPLGFAAIITDSEKVSHKAPSVTLDAERLVDFHDGDVVLINPNGEVIFLYEKTSAHNAILATERCNHRCIMCPQPPIAQEKDKTDFNIELISLFDKSTKEVGITGGEPTLIGDNLFKIIKHIQKELPDAAISLLSNGVKFADKSYALKLAQCRHHDLQIDIPLFSDIAKEHNAVVGAKTFYKTVQGLYNLALFRQKIGLRVVIHKKTYKRLPQFADYIYHNFPFVSQVAFIQMETTGLAKENIAELWIDPYDYNEELRQAVLLLANRGMNPYIYNAQLCVLPEDVRKYAMQSISDWKDIYLPECETCSLKGQCGGFFASNREHHSDHIKPIINDISHDI